MQHRASGLIQTSLEHGGKRGILIVALGERVSHHDDAPGAGRRAAWEIPPVAAALRVYLPDHAVGPDVRREWLASPLRVWPEPMVPDRMSGVVAQFAARAH